MRISKLLAATAALAIASFTTTASAASFGFSFTDTSSNILASGSLTTNNTPSLPGGFNVASISGTVTGFGAITGLINNPNAPAVSSNGLFFWDNVIFPASPHVTLNGLLFTTAGAQWNIYRNGADVFTGHDGTRYIPNRSGTQFAGVFTLTAVPEPASWAMMIAGFGLVGGAMRRGRQPFRKISAKFG